MEAAEQVNSNYTISVDTVKFSCNDRISMRYGDIRKRLISTHASAAKRLTEIHKRQNDLHSSYREYLDLVEDAKRYERRVARIDAALSESEHFEDMKQSQKDGKDISNKVAVVTNSATPLWEIMLAILEETGEIQVIELELVLNSLGLETGRSALESALKTHPNEFRIRGDRHGKFVSLKGV